MAGKRKKELRELLGTTGKSWKAVLRTIDTNHDGAPSPQHTSVQHLWGNFLACLEPCTIVQSRCHPRALFGAGKVSFAEFQSACKKVYLVITGTCVKKYGTSRSRYEEEIYDRQCRFMSVLHV